MDNGLVHFPKTSVVVMRLGGNLEGMDVKIQQDIEVNPALLTSGTALPTTVLKVCTRCLLEKGIDEFNLLPTAPDGHHPVCKVCLSEVGKLARAKRDGNNQTPEEQWALYMKQLYLDSIRPGAPAATRDLYAVLMGKKVERKEISLALNPDEIMKRNLEARRMLEAELAKEVTDESAK